jgi:hypothetical protein
MKKYYSTIIERSLFDDWGAGALAPTPAEASFVAGDLHAEGMVSGGTHNRPLIGGGRGVRLRADSDASITHLITGHLTTAR